jgi:mRNA interferase HigB
MRIISPKLLREFSKKHARAESSLKDWIRKAERASWKHFSDVRLTFSTADQVTLPSAKLPSRKDGSKQKKALVIFNVGGNDYRVIVSIHYKAGIVYTRFALTHAEYDKGEWKKQI